MTVTRAGATAIARPEARVSEPGHRLGNQKAGLARVLAFNTLHFPADSDPRSRALL